MMGQGPLFRFMFAAGLMLAGIANLSACHSSSASDPKSPAAAERATTVNHAKAADDAKADPNVESDPPADKKADTEEGLHLKPAEVKSLGVVTEDLRVIKHAPEASGYGLVIAHETIAQSLADLRTAKAVARQSESARDRGRRLAGTAGAMPVDTQENAERQATVDQAALELVRQRLTSTYDSKGWSCQRSSIGRFSIS